VAQDPYEVLGVRVDATHDEIHRAYVQLARAHHPDFFVDASPAERATAEARMRAVNEAWDVLRDASRRRALADVAPRPFQAFSPEDDEPDPREQPDVPYRPAPPPSTRSRLTTIAPVASLAAALGAGAVGMATGVVGLLGVALVLLGLAAAGFLALPLLALGRAKRDEG
jgi:curved DNA-binding protein CbpA